MQPTLKSQILLLSFPETHDFHNFEKTTCKFYLYFIKLHTGCGIVFYVRKWKALEKTILTITNTQNCQKSTLGLRN